MNNDKNSLINKYTTCGIPFIVLLGSFFHFLYGLSGKFFLVGFIAPISESVFEHLKLPLVPTILWWLITYIILKSKQINLRKWLASALFSYLINISFIIILYYTYTGALGIESVFLDILSYILGTSLGQIIGFNFYTSQKTKNLHYLFIFIIALIVFIIFIVFTYNPPNLPIFNS